MSPLAVGSAMQTEDREEVSLAIQSGLTAEERAEALALATRSGLKVPALTVRGTLNADDVEEVLSLAVQSGLKAEERSKALAVAAGSGVNVEKVFFLAARSGLKAEDAEQVLHLDVRSGLNADEILSLAVRTGLKAEEDIYPRLFEQLLANFSWRDPRADPELQEWQRPTREPQVDPKLLEWERPPPCISRKQREPPKCYFYLFKMKASAKAAHVSWWMKKYARFPPERAGFKGAIRVARLAVGTDGFHLEQAGEGGQPGAISCTSGFYMGCKCLKVVDEGSVRRREVAVIKRLPAGDGVFIMSKVDGLGVKVHDILFVMERSSMVALSFIERWFYVSSKFAEETVYADGDLNFIDITLTVESLIKKLYQMYEQEEHEKKIMQEEQGHQETEEQTRQQEELMLQREEQERNKVESLRRRREEKKKHKTQRIDMKKAVHQLKEAGKPEEKPAEHEKYEEYCTPILFDDSNWMKPLEEDLSQSEERRKELLEAMKPMAQNDLLNMVEIAQVREQRNSF